MPSTQNQGLNSTSAFLTSVQNQIVTGLALSNGRIDTVETNLGTATTGNTSYFVVNHNSTVEDDKPMYRTERSRDNATAVQTGDKLGSYEYWGHSGTEYAIGCGIKSTAAETWDATSNGAFVEVFTTPIGTIATQPRLTIRGDGNVVVGTAAIATTATDGFLYIPTCPGPPTGVPTTETGTVALCFDSANSRLYAYNGAWVSALFA